MKKIFLSLLIIFLVSDNLYSEELRVIPYPEGLDTKSEGASSAPVEINHKFSIYFDTMTDYFVLKSSRNRVILENYPTYQQTREHTCGPAAVLTVFYWYGVKDYTEMDLAREMNTKPYPVGTNPSDILEFFKRIDWEVESSLTHSKFEEYDDFKNFVIENLKAGTPILVDNIEWGGHWRVIIGYDTMGTESTLDDVLILEDPYDTCDHKQDGYAVNNGKKFFSMWFAHSNTPENEKIQPFIIAKPKNK